MPFEAAAQMERDLAEDLQADGYTVTVVHNYNSVHSLAVAKRTLKASEEAQADVDARVLKWLDSLVKNPTAKHQ
jgi:hypothetical protein